MEEEALTKRNAGAGRTEKTPGNREKLSGKKKG